MALHIHLPEVLCCFRHWRISEVLLFAATAVTEQRQQENMAEELLSVAKKKKKKHKKNRDPAVPTTSWKSWISSCTATCTVQLNLHGWLLLILNSKLKILQLLLPPRLRVAQKKFAYKTTISWHCFSILVCLLKVGQLCAAHGIAYLIGCMLRTPYTFFTKIWLPWPTTNQK